MKRAVEIGLILVLALLVGACTYEVGVQSADDQAKLHVMGMTGQPFASFIIPAQEKEMVYTDFIVSLYTLGGNPSLLHHIELWVGGSQRGFNLTWSTENAVADAYVVFSLDTPISVPPGHELEYSVRVGMTEYTSGGASGAMYQLAMLPDYSTKEGIQPSIVGYCHEYINEIARWVDSDVFGPIEVVYGCKNWTMRTIVSAVISSQSGGGFAIPTSEQEMLRLILSNTTNFGNYTGNVYDLIFTVLIHCDEESCDDKYADELYVYDEGNNLLGVGEMLEPTEETIGREYGVSFLPTRQIASGASRTIIIRMDSLMLRDYDVLRFSIEKPEHMSFGDGAIQIQLLSEAAQANQKDFPIEVVYTY